MTATNNNDVRLEINAAVLRGARSRAGLSTSEASSEANKILRKHGISDVTPADFVAWESGDERPTPAQAEAAARTCLIRYIDLFGADLEPLPFRDFRRPPSSEWELSHESMKRLVAFDRLYDLSRRVASELGETESYALPRIDPGGLTTDQSIREAATEVRSALGVTRETQRGWGGDEEGLAAWTTAVEGTGAFVFMLPFDVAELRGISRWDKGAPPAIGLSTADTIAARTFTLHHEFGHLAFGSDEGALCDPFGIQRRNGGEERLADRLAAEVLVPSDWLATEIPDGLLPPSYRLWPGPVRQRLHSTFNVSNAVIGIRLKDLGVVEDSGYRPYWRQPSSFQGRGRGGSRAERTRRQLGARASSLLKTAIESDAISVGTVARMLRMKGADIDSVIESS